MKDIIALAVAAAIPTAFAVAPAYAAETAEKEAVGVGLEGAFYVGRSFDKDASGKHLEGSLKLTLRARLSDSISIGAGVSNAPYGFTAESGAIDLEDAYVWLRYSGYGRLVAGRADNAAESLAITAPDVGYGTNGSGLDSWGPSLTDRAGDALSIGDRNAFSNTRLKLTEEQSVKLSYFTPSVYGLRAGISFAPKGGNGNRSDYLFGGLRYDRKVQQFGIGISGGLAFSSPREIRSPRARFARAPTAPAYRSATTGRLSPDRLPGSRRPRAREAGGMSAFAMTLPRGCAPACRTSAGLSRANRVCITGAGKRSVSFMVLWDKG